MMNRRFPDGFLLGCATAAHQVEGGLDNDWSQMEQEHPEKIKDGSSSNIGCDHYRRYHEDLEQLASFGHNAHRFSVEWSRVEPDEGHFDHDALRHYADVAKTCRSLGMEPVVTLFHFTLPRWLSDRGGVTAPEAPFRFARFVAACAEVLCDDVEWWITINEPNVLALLGYIQGEWPPFQQGLSSGFAAQRGLLQMHAAATAAIRGVAAEHNRPSRISIAHHERRLVGSSQRDQLAAALPDFIFNRWFLQSCLSGMCLPPVGKGEPVPGLKGSLDYVGLNHYSDQTVRFDPSARDTLFVVPDDPDDGAEKSTMGWTIEPDSLRRAVKSLDGLLHLPILVTENGVADNNDELRPKFIVDGCNALLDALEDGADLRGYLHWTSMDNFEWLEGYSQKFGIIAVDRTTLQRIPKPSAEIFAQICRTGEVSESQ